MHLKVDEELISLVIGEISALDGEAFALQGRLDTLKSAADEKVDQKATNTLLCMSLKMISPVTGSESLSAKR